MTSDAFAEQLFRAWLRSRLGNQDVYPSWENLPPDIRATWLTVSAVALALRESVTDRKK